MGPVVPQAFRYGSGGATRRARGGVGAARSPHEWFRRAPVITFAGPAATTLFLRGVTIELVATQPYSIYQQARSDLISRRGRIQSVQRERARLARGMLRD